jgi:serine protease Do
MPIPIPGRVAEDLRRSTVQVLTGSGRQQGNGSGIVLPNERVLTNAHVVRGARMSVESWEGRTHTATLLKADSRRDLALLSVAELGAPAVSLGDSDRLRPGTPVFAVGNPWGFVGAVSSGSIYAVGPVRPGQGMSWDQQWIQADIRLAPGNSGGPLATLDGQVVGINTMIVAGGLSLAVPSRVAESFIARLQQRTELGVTVRPVHVSNGQFGLMILELSNGGAAASASLLHGDILVGAGDNNFHYVDDLERALAQANGSTVTLHFHRGGTSVLRHVAVQLRPNPLSSAA